MSPHSFAAQDLDQLKEKGISRDDIEIQLQNFRKGFPPICLIAPALVGDGIIRLTPDEADEYARIFSRESGAKRIVKFVPASGAASRMFKSLFEFLNEAGSQTGSASGPGQNDPSAMDPAIKDFINGMEKFAFLDDLKDSIQKTGKNFDQLYEQKDLQEIIGTLVNADGLNYGQMPKGLIKFHRYEDECRTSVEEHLVEGAEYSRDGKANVNLHFTVSREHLDSFITLLNQVQQVYEARFGVKYNIEFSLQRSFTDTIAVDPENRPFRLDDGSILFRPGGHGALLTNLNEIDADLIFIKNIDNVCPDRMKPITYLFKKALAGILFEIQQMAFGYIRQLDEGKTGIFEEVEEFLEKRFCVRLSDEGKNLPEGKKLSLMRRTLNRPIRVCGMVKNEGEPGGGPFWTRNRDGSVSLQIVESAQINFSDNLQSTIAASATHFNPVDLVCATRDHQGNSFDLQQFTDPDTGLISGKSSDGRELKAQELPGLWNGSMSDWNTIFVEVPIETFNPVKTINDLLRPEHIA
ncbi:DUF4301 family protein [Bacteroidota bacterium]